MTVKVDNELKDALAGLETALNRFLQEATISTPLAHTQLTELEGLSDLIAIAVAADKLRIKTMRAAHKYDVRY